MQRGGQLDHPFAVLFGIESVARRTIKDHMVTILYDLS